MKKFFAVLTALFLFTLLPAEDTEEAPLSQPQIENDVENETENWFEKEPETTPETEEKPRTLPEWKTDYDSFYFQPTTGAGLGILSVLRANLNLDFYFNVKHTKRHNNIYLGLGTGVYFAPVWSNFFEFPFYGSVVFDFTTRRSKILKSASLWIEAGYLMIYWKAHKGLFGVDIDNTLFHWFIFGIGTDLLFKHNIVLRFGFENGEVLIPTFAIAVGYRF